MFGIGVSELLVIFLVALLVLGPERLPAAARTLAKLFGEFRKATDDLRSGLVGISDIDQDWRIEHNNPRVDEAARDKKKVEIIDSIAEDAPIARNSLTDPKITNQETEKSNG